MNRLDYAIEEAERQVHFRAEAGLGKSTVLRRALAQARSPRRRMVLIDPPGDRSDLFRRLAERLGQPAGRHPPRQALARALRVASLQGFQVVVAIDGWDRRREVGASNPGVPLGSFGAEDGVRLTVIQVASHPRGLHPDPDPDPIDPWRLSISLQRLTRSQAEAYLVAKLAAAGCPEPIMTPRALTRLHGLSSGIPRGLEQLVRLSLMAGAVRGLEVITPDVVDEVAGECHAMALL